MWELIITGCGVSHGTPPWGHPELWSEDPRDHRRRSGAVLRGPDGQVVLIDTGPDLLHQMRDPYKRWDGRSYPVDCITRCDGVLLTHVHADHSHGINDLRHLNRLMGGGGIGIHAHAAHLDELVAMFPYCFADPDAAYRMGSPALHAVAVRDDEPFALAGLRITPFAVDHGPAGRVTAWRMGGLAYLTDVKHLPVTADRHLQDVDLLVLNMLREASHPTHCNWAEAQVLIERIAPQRTILVHMGHEVRYAQWAPRLPPSVRLAVDGLAVQVEAV
ncbi:MAG: MBL fold metallo-hydrolase [Planctomycetota bacterium]